jgi:hypothetical protein
MKKHLLIIGFALAGILTGCQDVLVHEISADQRAQQKDSVWTVRIEASKGDGMGTKGLEIGEDGLDNTTVLRSIWKNDEPVLVYLGADSIGTLKATPDPSDAHKATLTGTVTTGGITPGETTLTLRTPRNDWDYTGQVGLLLNSNRSIESKYHYTMAENVLVTGVSNGAITTSHASFTNQQSIYRMNFRFQSAPVECRRVWISSDGGGLVLSRGLDGSSTTGTLDVTLDAATPNPFFVALRNNNTTSEEALRFKVMDYEGVTYYGTKTIPAQYKPNGTFVSMKNAPLTERLGVTLHTETTVTSAL